MAMRNVAKFLHRTPLRFFCSVASEASSGEAKGISVADFLKSIGHGVEAHAEKVANELQSVEELVLVRRMKLKKIGVPCKQRKMIMRYTEKYRQNLWKPKMVD